MVVDIQLIQAAKQGDKDSFAQVYQSVASDLFRVALVTLGNTYDADDVVSETFIEAYKGIARLRDPASFKPWIMKILSARCKRKIAEYIKSKSVFDIEDFMTTLGDDFDLGQSADNRVTVMGSFARLSHSERMIIVLSVFQGYTTREIAEIMNTPQGTISSKLHRSLAKLRRMLESGEAGTY